MSIDSLGPEYLAAHAKYGSLNFPQVYALLDSQAAKIAELEQAQERAYQMLEVNGVPRKRAKSVSNGIGVLATRLDRQEQASVPTGETCPHGDNGDCWRCATSPPPTRAGNQELYMTANELRAKIATHDYGAELMLQHALRIIAELETLIDHELLYYKDAQGSTNAELANGPLDEFGVMRARAGNKDT